MTNEELMDYYPRGCMVNVERWDDDQFAHDFTGSVIGYHNGLVTVRDQDGDCWDCDPDQIRFNTDEIMN